MFRIDFPGDGELLNHSHGAETAEGLRITVRGRGPRHRRITVNGAEARRDGEFFAAPVLLTEQLQEITAEAGGERLSVTPYYDRNSRRRYNFFIDDNAFFFRELAVENRRSLFDSFYLAALREIHREFGTKFTLNCFYENAHQPFRLSGFPDRFRGEWEENSGWLRLAFHADCEFPEHPYGAAYPEKLPEHYMRVAAEIRRFAGEQTLIPPVLVHFFDVADPAARRFLREQGMRCFTRSEPYWRNLRERTGREWFARFDSGNRWLEIPVEFFGNLLTQSGIREAVARIAATPGKELVNLGSHEQYCYPFYARYLPDHLERLRLMAELMAEAGYSSVFPAESPESCF